MKNNDFLKKVWEKAKPIPGKNPDQFRKDRYGDEIKFKDHGDRSKPKGWELDHKIARSKGGSDDLRNRQPLHWKNNVEKGDKPNKSKPKPKK